MSVSNLRLAMTLPVGLLCACYTGRTDADLGPNGLAPADDPSEPDGSTEEVEDDPAPLCQEGPSVGPAFMVRLTRAQYDNTIRDLLDIEGNPSAPIGEDEKVGPFSANTESPVSELTVEQYKTVAEDLALAAVTDLDALLPCDPAEGQDTCAEAFVETFGRHAYRRPLRDVEVDRYVTLYQGAEDFSAGIRLVVQSMLQSPYFLYRIEQGEGAPGEITELGPYELASRLSYFLWSSMPDDALLDAAADDQLRTPQQLRAQAERMLDDPRAADTIGSFHVQWLHVENADNLDKDVDRFPAYSGELGADMKADLAAFADHVIRQGDGRLETLLTAAYTFGGPELQDLYGVEPPPGHVPGEPIPLDPEQRAGLLTHPAVLAVHAHANQTSPVARGALIREQLLCHLLPSPPADVDDTPPEVDPNATLREQYAQHRDDASCSGCHQLIDGIGFGFEAYDGEGRFRQLEAGQPIDTTGEFVAAGDLDGPFDGAIELSARLASSELVRQCMATQWFRFSSGRDPADADACALQQIADSFADSDYNMRELLLALVVSDAFRYRQENNS